MRFALREKPKIHSHSEKKEGFDGWVKCPNCSEMIHGSELKKNLQCCPKCDHHFRLSSKERLKLLIDPGSFNELFTEVTTVDRLSFFDTEPYGKKIEAAREKTKSSEAVIVGVGKMDECDVAIGILDFSFMGGSMGHCVGERLTLLIEHALKLKLPLVIVSASGGARMQESIFSLMQMAKTSGALARLHEAKIPYISVLTDPTSGGVTASFATLGDIIIAEPKALICFAGPRVVEQVIREKLPKDAQKSEFLLKHGMIDRIVPRRLLKETISRFLDFLLPS